MKLRKRDEIEVMQLLQSCWTAATVSVHMVAVFLKEHSEATAEGFYCSPFYVTYCSCKPRAIFCRPELVD